MKNIFLIPAYEPDEKLLTLLKDIPKNIDVIIVNDGSNKEYDNIFNEAKKYAKVISYKDNHGKGYALKTGLNYIKDKYKTYTVTTLDSDGQHKVTDAINLANYAANNKDTLVLGKRMWDKNTPLRSRIGNTITRGVYKLFTGLRIYDTQTGLRSFSNELMEYMLNNDGNRYEYEMNALLNLKKANIKYHEIPISTIYFDNNKKSHFNTIKDSYQIYKSIFKWK